MLLLADDYASKHWSGLIADYYGARARGILDQALLDAAAGHALNATAIDLMEATLAYTWQTSTSAYPVVPVADAVVMSVVMAEKYGGWFEGCSMT